MFIHLKCKVKQYKKINKSNGKGKKTLKVKSKNKWMIVIYWDINYTRLVLVLRTCSYVVAKKKKKKNHKRNESEILFYKTKSCV